jgi:hypothetical protein
MNNPILKSLVESMIGNYLEESYEDDLMESILEEVSEETWEAIEEAILNELSPDTLKSYIKKSKKSIDQINKKSYDDAIRATRHIQKANYASSILNPNKNVYRKAHFDKRKGRLDYGQEDILKGKYGDISPNELPNEIDNKTPNRHIKAAKKYADNVEKNDNKIQNRNNFRRLANKKLKRKIDDFT